jgi:hypothetical protein
VDDPRGERQQHKALAWRSVTNARSMLGDGWHHVSDEVRWGLVCAELLGVVVGQNCLDNPKATAEELARVGPFALALWRAAWAIRENGWKCT